MQLLLSSLLFSENPLRVKDRVLVSWDLNSDYAISPAVLDESVSLLDENLLGLHLLEIL